MIRVVLTPGDRSGEPPLYCPQVFCDFCGRRIVAAREGYYEWLVDANLDLDPVECAVSHTHKGCGDSFRKARGGRWLSDELDLLAGRLNANLIDPPGRRSRKVSQ